MYTFSKHHLHYHVLAVLVAVWAIIFKLDLFNAQAQGSFVLEQPVITCVRDVPNVALIWSASANSDTYSVERKEGDASVLVGWGGSIMSQLKETTYVDNHYAFDYGRMPYSYRVAAYKDGARTYSNVISVVLPECTATLSNQFNGIATSTIVVYDATSTASTTTNVSLALPVATTTKPAPAATKTVVSTTKVVAKKKVTTPSKAATGTTASSTTQTQTTITQTQSQPQVAQPISATPTVTPPAPLPTQAPAPVAATPAPAPAQARQVVATPVNTLPIGYLELPYFATTSLAVGGSVSFMGSGDDLEGRIVAYEWRLGSCTTGALLSTATTFTKSDFPVGLSYVYFRVQDVAGAWSTNCQRRAIIVKAPAPQPVVTPAVVQPVTTVQAANKLPTVSISTPIQTTVNATFGTNIIFTGAGVDSDGTISSYEWRDGSCTAGVLLSTASSFSKADLSVGTHTMYFRAKDNQGAWSSTCVSRVVVITAVVAATVVATSTAPTPPITQPTTPAPVANVIPSSAIAFPTFATSSIIAGDSLAFSGSGTDTDGTITGYEWRDGSCTTGVLVSTVASFSSASFSVGTHQVYLRVKDNTGAWSTNCPKRAVIVAAAPVVTTPPPVTTPPAPTTSQTSTPNTSGKFPSWMKWGMFVGWQDTAMSSFEALTGKQPQMEALFSHWGNDQFPSTYGPRIRDKGRTMVLFWEAVDYNRDYFSQPEYSFDSVIAGKMDAYFAKFAADAKAYGGEVILVPYSEFNGDWFPWSMTNPGNTPAKFKQAWIHIHSFFANVPNVKFAWVPNNDSVPDIAATDFDLNYPGSQYVDYVGLDGFNSNPWETFDGMMGKELVKLEKYNKPIYIMSMGVKADARKAAWITDAFTNQLYKYPKVVGWVWFNENKEFDWRVNSSADSLAAFKAMIP